MEPCHAPQATLADLLERVLDKGIMLKLDLVIGVAGIPLIGISLQGAIAAIETMLGYGMMDGWEAGIRADVVPEAEHQWPGLRAGEHAMLDTYGSYHHARGIFRVWRPGRLILTEQRLLVIRPAPAEMLFETPVSAISGIGRICEDNIGGAKREIVCLALADGTFAALYTPQPDQVEASLRARLHRLGQPITEICQADLKQLGPGAVAQGRLWHHWDPEQAARRWQSGWTVLTPSELTWRPDTSQRDVLRVPLTDISALTVEPREVGMLGEQEVLVITHRAGSSHTEALFAGEGIGSWSAVVQRAAHTPDWYGDA
jgi:Gas vesicle protein